MGRRLEGFLNSLNTSDKHARTVFWLFWLCLFFYLMRKLEVKYEYWSMHHPEHIVGPFLFWFLTGELTWWLLRKEKFLPIRNVAVGLIGFLACVSLPSMILLLVLMVISRFFAPNPSVSLIFTILFASGFFGGAFLGGCWIGFKNGGSFLQWCVVGAAIVVLPLAPSLRSVTTKDISFMIALFALSILGGYVGKGYSAKPNVTNEG